VLEQDQLYLEQSEQENSEMDNPNNVIQPQAKAPVEASNADSNISSSNGV
jgi:hypothetical protein